MKKFAISALAVTALFAVPAIAGSPHFVSVDADLRGKTVEVSGKEAGLGNESQVHIVISAEAACVNKGGNFPSAENKQSFNSEDDFPVQNGKADFSLTLTATFQPKCSPPMNIVWGPTVTVTDTTNGITTTVPL